MLAVIVKFTVLPGRMAEFLGALRANARSSLRDEPGCRRFDVHRSRDNEDEVLLYEIYRDQEAAFPEDLPEVRERAGKG
jgi:autoinducer 2-degrading protein